MIDAAIEASPRRPSGAVRRGVVHNSHQLPDGTWAWRYDLMDPGFATSVDTLWADLDELASRQMPAMLVRGGESGFVTAPDLAEMNRRLPGLRVETVPGAGHAVQSDQPAALAGLIADFGDLTSRGRR